MRKYDELLSDHESSPKFVERGGAEPYGNNSCIVKDTNNGSSCERAKFPDLLYNILSDLSELSLLMVYY